MTITFSFLDVYADWEKLNQMPFRLHTLIEAYVIPRILIFQVGKLNWNPRTLSLRQKTVHAFSRFLFAKRPTHKVLAYVEYRTVSAWRLRKYWPPIPLSNQRVCPTPAPRGGGGYTARWGGGGVNILEDARHWIGLLQYNLSTGLPVEPFHFRTILLL